ncbi:hypothetical protein [Aquirhabdus parva]|uniref:Uncharacterized protein n=1 Tax=Aquirhabdus parva TaxID=2283318 RepID=A0A345P540_9GAMM|nr:hypothetical protein [Aquirhabdus parva]AXI02399.1 hypothetical protein HYN46_05860 [Aquirhabdus parva]
MSEYDSTRQLNSDHSDPSITEKKSRRKSLLDHTLKHARDVADMASDATRDFVGVVGDAKDAAMSVVDVVASGAARGVVGAANFTTDTMRGVVSGTSETARDVALLMARTFLGNTTLTLPLPELLLNKQIRKRIEKNSDIDDITVDCGDDRLSIKIIGHYKRALYTLRLDFNVLECEISKEKFLRLRQVDESLDVQLRDANVLTNWAARKISSKAFDVINSLPIPSLINHIIRDIPGIQQEGYRVWYIDLDKAGFIDFLNNRSWMLDKLLSLSDFSVLPGLNILRESKELMQQLVNQFEVRGLRVQPGRLEVQVGINKDKD